MSIHAALHHVTHYRYDRPVQLGPQVMLAVKVRMKPGISIEQAVEKLNALERSIKARFPEVAWCFIEPDTTD